MIPHVLDVKPLPALCLELRFDTNESRVFDAKPYLDRGRYLELQDESLFAQVYVAFGTVEWPNGADFDPEDLYSLSLPVSG